MNIRKTSNKGFLGDFLGSILPAAGGLAGSALQAFGVPAAIGGAGGTFLGSQLGNLARGLPFRKGQTVGVPMMKKASKAKKPAHMVKGSKAAKAHMSKLRKMKK